ncbi:glycosyltransferase [Isoptericola sp. NPDC019482]|uniref:glycosyltransferase n=1 Tax=Isoptericola sp. NPDC019482 TaxID=3154688 RepID=UPI003488F41C
MKVLRVSHSAVVDAWRERERELRRRGIEVRVLSARSWEAGGRPVHLAPRPGEDVVGIRTAGRHPALFLYDPCALWRELGRPHDVLDVHEEPFALATAEILALRGLRRALGRGQGRSAPYVLYSAQNIHKRYPVPFRWFERLALRGAAAVVACNSGAARIVTDKGLRGPAPVVPLGVSLSAEPPERPPWRDDVVRVGYAGRLEPHKGVQVLLDAVGGRPDDAEPELLLVLAGDGSLRAEVAAAAAASGGRIDTRGSLPPEDLPAFYAGIDVLAVPSLQTPGWVEQFGRVAVEAMSCGTPVVATATGALPDVVGDAGVLVPPDDAVALRDAVVAVGTDPNLAARLRAAGLERAAECGWPAVAARYHDLYDAVLETPGGAPADVRPGRDVEVIVVAYGRADLLGRALAPLAGHLPVTVVDNSSDDTVRTVTLAHGARYLDPGHNGGFASGVTYGLAHRRNPEAHVLLLNPDAVVDPADVHLLAKALDADPGLAAVGPAQTDEDGRPARVSWPFPSPRRAWLEAVGLGRVAATRPADQYVIGSVLLLRVEALAQVGGLDTGYFLYAEEADWARRASDVGWRHAVVPEAHAMHVGGATSTDPAERDRLFHASLERYLRKHHGPTGWRSAQVAMLAGALVRAVRRGAAGATARRRLRIMTGARGGRL